MAFTSLTNVRKELEDVTLDDVDTLDKELGRGAYGRVFTVKYCGLVCAAKEIHPILIDSVNPEEKQAIKDAFIRECINCSTLRHPNIVQFMGVFYSSQQSNLPIMVMEMMATSLTSYVQNNRSKITLTTKMSILHDVSLGLSYLHKRKPPVIHRDLSSNNVMLTDKLVAKIGDLGVAKVIHADSRQTRSKLTTAPGTIDFMPPETLEANPVYGTLVDVFSFAGITLHVCSEEWPTPLGPKGRDPVTKKLVALSEAERRQPYLDKVAGRVAVLKQLVERCLDDDPDERPPMKEVSEMIESLMVCCSLRKYRLFMGL